MQQDLIFKKRGIWTLKLQYRDPDLAAAYGRKREKSLQTRDKREALIRAAPLIAEHNLRLFEAQNRKARRLRVEAIGWKHPLGDYLLEDGTRVISTEKSAVFLKDGVLVREEPNDHKITLTARFDPALVTDDPARPKVVERIPVSATNDDRSLFEDWKKERKPTLHKLNEAEKAWRVFQDVCGGKALINCLRPDGRAVVEGLQALGQSDATVNKHLSYLNSIANIAIDNGHLKFNPFSKCRLKVKDEKERVSLNEDEMKLMRDHFPEMGADERLAWVLLACTGMRLDEPFQVTSEQEADGIRYIVTGSKTESSLRRIPLPDATLPFLPKKITGPLFKMTSKSMGQKLRRRMRDVGITREGTTLHSLRHRAKDRMRDSRDPEIETKINDAITGHGEVTVGDGYGKGEAIWKLKRAIDVIGY